MKTPTPYIELPKQVTEVMTKLGDHGYNSYIYGECVRMHIKGQTPFEYSLLTNADLSRLPAIFDGYKIISGDYNDKDSQEFTVAVLGITLMISCYDSREGGSDLQTELQMKQAFTINAIAYSLDGQFHDFWNGLDALSKNEIVFIESDETFNHLDIMPALMLYADGEFTISNSAMKLISNHYTKIAASGDEVEAIIMGKNARDVLSEYSEVFTAIIPELQMLETLKENPDNIGLDLLAHTFRCVGLSAPELTLRYALLFHELGKPDCYAARFENGVAVAPTFDGHIERARIYASRIMIRLCCSDDDIYETGFIIENAEYAQRVLEGDHGVLMDLKDEFSSSGLKRLLRFNHAICRANSDEKAAMKYYKILSLI